MKKYLFYSTVFSVFTESFVYSYFFDVKLFYFIVLLNFLILFQFRKIRYSIGLLIFHLVILINGLFTTIFGYNDIVNFIIQYTFLLYIPIYFYSFYSYFKNDFEQIVELYCLFSFIVSIVGFIMLPFQISKGEAYHSIMTEPAHFCTVVLPAFFITFRDKKYNRLYYIVLLLAIILSGSSIGYLGVGASLLLQANKFSFFGVSVSAIVLFFISFWVYSSYAPLRLRIDDTVRSSKNMDLSDVNLSTYALLSNFYVSTQSFKSNPILGNGIGSHTKSRELYLKNIEGIEIFEKMEMDQLNSKDAGSLFSRIMSELGVLGLCGIFYFIFKFYVTYDRYRHSYNVISKGILLYFGAKLLREGHYFSPEMYFLVFLYVFNYYNSKITI